ncbi:MAG TPA: tetratricopeptide repeat protein [Candidatus Saccharimonadales bacterium]|nr:tetratricopeptide repeat protein [Candidatus Saccharimonadales bacterium]
MAWQILGVLLAASLTACGPRGGRDLRQGEHLIDSGQPADAIPALKDAIEELPGASPAVQARAWNLLGLAYHGAGQWDAAAQAYLKALQLDRDLVAADYNMGCLRMAQTNFPSAIDYLTTYTTLQPRNPDGFLNLGRARLDLAVERFGPEKLRLIENAKRDFEYAEKLHTTAEAPNALGVIDLQRRNAGSEPVRDAIAHFQLALKRNPHYAPALLNLAIVSQRYLNDPREALQRYRDYLAADPSSSQAKEIEKLIHQLDIDSRITIVPRAPERPAPAPPKVVVPPSQPVLPQPKPAPVENPVLKTEIHTSAPSPPLERPKSRVTVQPGSPPPRSPEPPPYIPPINSVTSVIAVPAVAPVVRTPKPLAIIPTPPAPSPTEPPPQPKKTFAQKLNPLHWFGGKLTKDDDVSETFIPIDSGHAERYVYPSASTPVPGDSKTAERLTEEGRRAERLSHRAQAIRDYQEAGKADPTYYPAALALGLGAIDAQDYTLALDALGRALALRETSADARYAFAWVLGKRGYYQDAANELEKLLVAHPRELRAHLLLGNFYSGNLGQPKLAREHYRQVLEIDPKNSQAGAIRTWLSENP